MGMVFSQIAFQYHIMLHEKEIKKRKQEDLKKRKQEDLKKRKQVYI